MRKFKHSPEIAEKMRELRKLVISTRGKLGMTQKAFGEFCGLYQGYMFLIENLRINPSEGKRELILDGVLRATIIFEMTGCRFSLSFIEKIDRDCKEEGIDRKQKIKQILEKYYSDS